MCRENPYFSYVDIDVHRVYHFSERDEIMERDLSKLPAAAFDHPELDPAVGVDYCGSAEDFLFILKTYQESIEGRVAQIEADIEAGDLEALTLVVHSLKSSSRAIGAEAFVATAKALEEAGKQGDLEAVRRDAPALLDEYRKLGDIIKSILDSCP